MRAQDLMTTSVVTVGPDASVREIATKLLENRISALPVVDNDGQILGIVSEGDLMRRPEIGTGRRHSWWLALFEEGARANEYIKSHGNLARDVMTRDLVTVPPDTSAGEIAALLERNRIKRVPVLDDGKLVGIVSRANLLHGLTGLAPTAAPSKDDNEIRANLIDAFSEAGIQSHLITLVVRDGAVSLFGSVRSENEKEAVRVAFENVDGITGVEGEVSVISDAVVPGY